RRGRRPRRSRSSDLARGDTPATTDARRTPGLRPRGQHTSEPTNHSSPGAARYGGRRRGVLRGVTQPSFDRREAELRLTIHHRLTAITTLDHREAELRLTIHHRLTAIMVGARGGAGLTA